MKDFLNRHYDLHPVHKAVEKRHKLAQRMKNIIMLDKEIEGRVPFLRMYFQLGKYWYNCMINPERLWWI